MRAGFILFTQEGERVPFFVERHPGRVGSGEVEIGKHGWKTKRTWVPGFFVVKRGRNYRAGGIAPAYAFPVAGSVYQMRAWDWQPLPEQLLALQFPNIASVEMYLRHVEHGQ